jgi:hypothetical protein
LTGENDQGDGFHIGGGNPGDGVRGPRARRHKANPHTPGCSGVSVCGVDSALLMADQNMVDVVFVNLIVNVENRSTRIAEDDLHVFILEYFQQNLRAFQPHIFFHSLDLPPVLNLSTKKAAIFFPKKRL